MLTVTSTVTITYLRYDFPIVIFFFLQPRASLGAISVVMFALEVSFPCKVSCSWYCGGEFTLSLSQLEQWASSFPAAGSVGDTVGLLPRLIQLSESCEVRWANPTASPSCHNYLLCCNFAFLLLHLSACARGSLFKFWCLCGLLCGKSLQLIQTIMITILLSSYCFPHAALCIVASFLVLLLVSNIS